MRPETGQLGYPRTEIVDRGTLRTQGFEHGILVYDPATKQVTLET